MMKARHPILVFAAMIGALGATSPTGASAFEKIAYIDSFDYPECFETETAEGSVRILDNVLKTGATTILWRNQSGAIPRYPSAEEALPLKEPPLDKRRIPLSEPIRGWVRFDGCGTNLIQVAADECARRGVTFGIHMTTEENHGESWTLSPWNLEHPQFWCCARGGAPWPGRCSLAYDEVLAHKLRLVDELLAMKPAMIYIDLCRAGGWGPNLEFVIPMENEWRKLYGCEPPTNWRDSRWLALVEKYVYRYVAGIRERVGRTGRRVELVMAVERFGSREDYDYIYRAVDWRKMLRTGVIDSVAVACVAPDWKDPWGSTARIYGDAVREVRGIGRGKVYFPIMSYNFANRPGYPEYVKQTGLSRGEVVGRLLKLARDAGGDGITMEVVDINNYSPDVCKAIREFGTHGAAAMACCAVAKDADVAWTRVIAQEEGRQCSWPSVAKAADGSIIAVFSGDREAHVCPWGKVQMVKSKDGGETWSAPRTIGKTKIDDRDAGIVLLPDGRLFVAWFNSVAYRTWFDMDTTNYPPGSAKAKWQEFDRTMSDAEKRENCGFYGIWSSDNGETWTKPEKLVTLRAQTPHGPILMRDGSLLQFGRRFDDNLKCMFTPKYWEHTTMTVERSVDGGHTWKTLCDGIPDSTGENDRRKHYFHEPHVAELPNGELYALIRADYAKDVLMRQTRSKDGGKTWEPITPTTLSGLPPHLLVLSDGRLLAVYGRRTRDRGGFGEYASISSDGGRTWSEELKLSGATNPDLGYPASIELSPGVVLTVYYQQPSTGGKPCIMATKWKVPVDK